MIRAASSARRRYGKLIIEALLKTTMSTTISQAYRPVSGVIFDMDGLLLDTEPLYHRAYQAAMDREGKGKTYTDQFHAKLLGRVPKECSRMMVEEYGLAMTPKEFMEAAWEEQKKIFPEAGWLPGAAKLVHHLYKNKVPLALATSSGDEQFELKMTNNHRLFKMFKHVVKGSEVEKGKPEPDIYLKCAGLMGLDPTDCLAFEDSPAGVASGAAAGMQTVMIPDEKLPREMTKQADLVLDSAHKFIPEAFGLPPFGYRPVTHVIFDMDGLLLDTNKLYSQTTSAILAEHGKIRDLDFSMTLIGRRHQDIAPKVIKHYGLPYTVDEYTAEYGKRMNHILHDCKPLEGVERLVNHLHKHKIPMAVATSSLKEFFAKKTQRHRELFEKFGHVVNGCDPELKAGKPAPDIFMLAADRFPDRPDYGRCLVFEDAPNGAEAAEAAGMQCVMIPEQNRIDPDYTLKATQLLTTMAHFRPEDFGLPPFTES